MSGGTFSVERTPLAGVLLVRCRAFGDARGQFYESWRADAFRGMGIPGPFVQDNHSRSGKGVLRGLHWQDGSAPQGKLLRCTAGSIFDVVVDLRAGSPAFGRFHAVTLSAADEAPALLWVPPGFAHGFLSLEEGAEVQYRCTGYWSREAERCLRWDDPEVGIPWPLCGRAPVVSYKDARGMTLAQVRRNPSFTCGGSA